ncbi:MAG: hypothetical protein KGI50_06430 [Patescibacteria group bacterium]|nr:hypothetical protein [Patescibacteria group bacterium]MDE2439128.1 hypothetical protein [Patescibacteria group bacterium]
MAKDFVSKSGNEKILEQIANEYEEGQSFLRNKKQRWTKQLVLMSNLRRGDSTLGSNSLFSFFYRVMANLYDDKRQIAFVGNEDSDYKKTEMLNKLSMHDYDEMDKSVIDYDWLWDALFFGEGYLETMSWDEEKKLMVPCVINPLAFAHDPKFSDVQKWRFYSKWILRSGADINLMIRSGSIENIRNAQELPAGMEPELWDYTIKREQAKDTNATDQSGSGQIAIQNNIYQIMEHATYDQNGDKWIYWTDKNFSKLIRRQKVDFKDGKKYGDIETSRWPLVRKIAFREPHSTQSVSIPDLIEDKHRARNVLINLMFIAAKDEANPLYVFDEGAIVDANALLQRQVSQHIAVKKGSNPSASIVPLNTKQTISSSLNAFLSMLQQESLDAIGISQPNLPQQPKGKKSATEAAVLQMIAEMTSTLQNKILNVSEKEFWSHWYHRYINPDYIKDGDKKIISVSNASGIIFEEIELDGIKTKYPPRVKIISSKEAEFKKNLRQAQMMKYFPLLQGVANPSGMKNFMKYVFLPSFIDDSSTISLIMPDTIDEIKAHQENEMIAKNKLPSISDNDDDEVHMAIHLQARGGGVKWAHYFAHEEQLANKKEKEKQSQAQQQMQQQKPQQGQGGGVENILQGSQPMKKTMTNMQKGTVPQMK